MVVVLSVDVGVFHCCHLTENSCIFIIFLDLSTESCHNLNNVPLKIYTSTNTVEISPLYLC